MTDNMYYEGDESAAALFLCKDIKAKNEKKKVEFFSITLQKLHLAAFNNNFSELYGTAYCWLVVKPNKTDTIDENVLIKYYKF